jgi:hypothetical protein
VRRSLFVCVAVVSALLVQPRAYAVTKASSCGLTWFTSVRLTKDIDCGSNAGIIAGADGITIDLGGHTLTGNRTNGVNGVDAKTFDHVTVRNGTLDNFGHGVTGSGTHLHVSHVTAIGNRNDGIYVDGAHARISHCTASGNSGDGITDDRADAVVRSCHVIENADHGVYITTDAAHVRSVVAEGNGFQGILLAPSANSVVSSSTTNSNDEQGIAISGDNARVVSSTANGNGSDGIDISGESAKIGQLRRGPRSDRNHASFNGFATTDNNGDGIFVSFASIAPRGRNVAHDNDDPNECVPTSIRC